MLGKRSLGDIRGNRRELRSLGFRCTHCNTRGHAPEQFELYIPANDDHLRSFISLLKLAE